MVYSGLKLSGCVSDIYHNKFMHMLWRDRFDFISYFSGRSASHVNVSNLHAIFYLHGYVNLIKRMIQAAHWMIDFQQIWIFSKR